MLEGLGWLNKCTSPSEMINDSNNFERGEFLKEMSVTEVEMNQRVACESGNPENLKRLRNGCT